MTSNELEHSADLIAELSETLAKDKQLSLVAHLLSMALMEISDVLAKRDNQTIQQTTQHSHAHH